MKKNLQSIEIEDKETKAGKPEMGKIESLNKPVVRTMPKDPVGLAVEVFCANIKDPETKGISPEVVMTASIDLVKQAQEAFN